VRARTVEEYDRSAKETIVVGTSFEYQDDFTEEWWIGYYDQLTERLTILTDDDRWIINHFRCPEGYVERLTGSTYAERAPGDYPQDLSRAPRESRAHAGHPRRPDSGERAGTIL
jgi:hypothetical protein